MAKLKTQKIEDGQKFLEKTEDVLGTIVTEYRGVTAEDLRTLRCDLREVEAQYTVVKNRVLKKIFKEEGRGEHPLPGLLRGPVGLTLIRGDVAQGAKKVFKFAKDNSAFKVIGGVIDGQAVDEAQLKAISDLPSKDVLLAKIVGTLVAPHRGLLGVLEGVNAKLVRTLAAIRDTKSAE